MDCELEQRARCVDPLCAGCLRWRSRTAGTADAVNASLTGPAGLPKASDAGGSPTTLGTMSRFIESLGAVGIVGTLLTFRSGPREWCEPVAA